MQHRAPTSGLSPCPKCGYDLRAHCDSTRCPECGQRVIVSATLSEASRWIDLRILDLWSIGFLQVVGCLTAIVSLIATRQGHFVALFLGMMAAACMATASLWLVGLGPWVVYRTYRPYMRAFGKPRLRRLRLWCAADLALVLATPVVLRLFWF